MTGRLALNAGIAVLVASALGAQARPTAEWPVYGGSPASDRYSPLTEITPANVERLAEAWRFDTGETGGFQVNPIVVDGVVY
jgi:quinoprotein glucose dehydrogenase